MTWGRPQGGMSGNLICLVTTGGQFKVHRSSLASTTWNIRVQSVKFPRLKFSVWWKDSSEFWWSIVRREQQVEQTRGRMGNCFSSDRVPTTESSDHILQPFPQTHVTLHGDSGQVVTQHVHGVPVVQDVPIVTHRPLPDPLESQLGKLSRLVSKSLKNLPRDYTIC